MQWRIPDIFESFIGIFGQESPRDLDEEIALFATGDEICGQFFFDSGVGPFRLGGNFWQKIRRPENFPSIRPELIGKARKNICLLLISAFCAAQNYLAAALPLDVIRPVFVHISLLSIQRKNPHLGHLSNDKWPK
jgi:hypothetical protein